MEEINQPGQKMKITQNQYLSSLDEVSDILEDFSLSEDIQLSLKQSQNKNEILNIIGEKLNKFSNLKNLTIKLKNLVSLDILELFKYFKRQDKIEQLHIVSNCFITSFNEQPLGNMLSQFFNLTNLILNIDCRRILLGSDHLNFLNAYQSMSQLNSLSIELNSIPKNSLILIDIFSGLQYLQNLRSFGFEISRSSITKEGSYNTLIAELRELKSLIDLSIIISDEDAVSNKIVQQISSSIAKLQNLERLTYHINCKPQRYCFLQGFQDLLNLKYISFQIIPDINLRNLIEHKVILKSCPSLEETDLQLLLRVNDNELVLLSQNLSEIKSLKKLNLKLCYQHALVNLNDMFCFLPHFNCQSGFTNLNLAYFNRNSAIKLTNEEFDQCIQKFSNLKELKFSLLENFSAEQEVMSGREWISLIKYLSQLTKLDFNLSVLSQFNNHQQVTLQFGDLIENMKNLSELSIRIGLQYLFNQDELIKIINQLQEREKLKELQIILRFNNNFNDALLISFQNSFYFLKNLTLLQLKLGKSNSFSQEGIKSFSDGLRQLPALTCLNLKLSKRNMEFEYLEIIFQSLQFLPSLKDLTFYFSNLRDQKDPKQITEIILFPPKLKQIKIKIKQPNLKFIHIQNLIQGILQMKQLKRLYLVVQLDNMEQIDAESIEKGFSQLKNLIELTFDLNRLSINLTNLFNYLPYLQVVNTYKHKVKGKDRFFLVTFNKQQSYAKENSLKVLNQKVVQNQRINEDLRLEDQITASIKYPEMITDNDIINMRLAFKTVPFTKMLFEINIWNIKDEPNLNNLFESFQFLTHINELCINVLKGSEIGTQSLNALGKTLSQLKTLKYFRLEILTGNEKIKWDNLQEFLKGMKNSRLEKLDINISNSTTILSQVFICQIFQSLPQKNYLQRLSLEFYGSVYLHNSFFEVDLGLQSLENLSEFIFFMNHLYKLRVEYSKFLLQQIAKIKNLRSLCITIPRSFRSFVMRKCKNLVSTKMYHM